MRILTSEAARLLGVASVTVRAMERRGELVAERTSTGVRLFELGEVERLARQRGKAEVPDAEAVEAL